MQHQGVAALVGQDGGSWEFVVKSIEEQNKGLKKEKKMEIKQIAKDLRSKIEPYEKYLFAAALLIAIDYFIFKGGLSDRIKKLFGRVSDKLMNILDKAIDKLGV